MGNNSVKRPDDGGSQETDNQDAHEAYGGSSCQQNAGENTRTPSFRVKVAPADIQKSILEGQLYE